MVVKDVAIDYLTITRPWGEFRPENWLKDLQRLVMEEWYGGNALVESEDWGWIGYRGRKFGPLRWGSSDQGAVVVISGECARLVTKVRVPSTWRASRIDLQATVEVEGGADAHIRKALSVASAYNKTKQGRPAKMSHINGLGDGDTLNIGSRHSEKYVRVYNKSAEEREDGPWNKVRYELECKAETADRIWKEINVAANPDAKVAELLKSAMEYYGFSLPIEAGVASDDFWKSVSRETKAEEQLLWLEKQVSPTVKRLVAMGLRLDVLQALGLSLLEETQERLV